LEEPTPRIVPLTITDGSPLTTEWELGALTHESGGTTIDADNAKQGQLKQAQSSVNDGCSSASIKGVLAASALFYVSDAP
jgi:hypothetical protein